MKLHKLSIAVSVAFVCVIILSGCSRALSDGVSIGVTDGLSDGIATLVADLIGSVSSNGG